MTVTTNIVEFSHKIQNKGHIHLRSRSSPPKAKRNAVSNPSPLNMKEPDTGREPQSYDFEAMFSGDVKVEMNERYMPYKDVIEMCKQREWKGKQISEVTIDWKVVQKGEGRRSIEEAQQLMKEKNPDTVVKVWAKDACKKGILVTEKTILSDDDPKRVKELIEKGLLKVHSRLVIVN